jgi:hypothetical protein
MQRNRPADTLILRGDATSIGSLKGWWMKTGPAGVV